MACGAPAKISGYGGHQQDALRISYPAASIVADAMESMCTSLIGCLVMQLYPLTHKLQLQGCLASPIASKQRMNGQALHDSTTGSQTMNLGLAKPIFQFP